MPRASSISLRRVGVFLDIGRVAGDVGDGEEFAQLAHDSVLIGDTVGADLFNHVFYRRQGVFAFNFAGYGGLRVRCEGEEQGQCEGPKQNPDFQSVSPTPLTI